MITALAIFTVLVIMPLVSLIIGAIVVGTTPEEDTGTKIVLQKSTHRQRGIRVDTETSYRYEPLTQDDYDQLDSMFG